MACPLTVAVEPSRATVRTMRECYYVEMRWRVERLAVVAVRKEPVDTVGVVQGRETDKVKTEAASL